jgi:hypothetical protein
MAAEKLDLYVLHKDEYIAPKAPQLVKIKPAKYLAITGKGDPGGEAFATKLGALYNVTFTIKMKQKVAGTDYKVCKLEGLWWGNKNKPDFTDEPKSAWNWKLLIRTPNFITEKHLKEAVTSLREKDKGVEVSEVQLEKLNEGLCVQMLHVGPYDEERKTIALMLTLGQKEGLSFHGLHHEIYLSDPRRVAPQKLKTILRMPVRK